MKAGAKAGAGAVQADGAGEKQGEDPPRLWLVDGSGYIFRAFYAIPTRLTSKKMPVNAVFGFVSMLLKLETSLGPKDSLAVVFDAGRDSFRNKIYPAYKANRNETPPELVPQFALTRDATRALGFAAVELEGFEADDLIASYARLAEAESLEVMVVSSDKDLMQLVRAGVRMWDPMKEREIGAAEVEEKFGVEPGRVVEVQALAGDSTDNVPGVPGIGIKTAAQLIHEYGDLETLLARAGEIRQPKRRESLENNREQARLSLRLVRLAEDVPPPVPLAQLQRSANTRSTRALRAFLEAHEFRSLIARLERDGRLPPAGAEDGAQGATEAERYELLCTEEAITAWATQARADGRLGVDTETTSLEPERATLVGISLALEDGRAGYIPIAHRAPAPPGAPPRHRGGGAAHTESADAGTDSLFAHPEDALLAEPPANQVPLEAVRRLLGDLLADESVLKIGQNLKYDLRILERHGMTLAGFDDTMLLSYVLEAGIAGHGLDALASRHLDRKMITYAEATRAETGRTALRFDEVSLERARDYASEDADAAFALWRTLRPQVLAAGRTSVYETLERPLVPILAKMEATGVRIDAERLRALSEDFGAQAKALEAECHALAGRTFSLGSPKQLAELLFDELGLSSPKRGKSGARSTDHDVLERLAAEGHALPEKVLAWRTLAKLRSTYTEALLESINPQTGRVHTHFSQIGAATGRLSSSSPSLQNIPIRTSDGRQIREAFIADEGFVLLSVDYSQIELRLAAEIAGEPALLQAFREGRDIHTATAAEMFHLEVDAVIPERRREAKAINFGILYGISPFGLARNLKIPQDEARRFINTYFERYPALRTWMDSMRARVRADGFVETRFGRRIHLPAIADQNPARRSFAERAAINAPIQGTAADIMRRAMIRLAPALARENLGARLLLQVHDELVLEVPEAECAPTEAVVRRCMEEAPLPRMQLETPLAATAGVGRNWAEAHS